MYLYIFHTDTDEQLIAVFFLHCEKKILKNFTRDWKITTHIGKFICKVFDE